MSSDPDKAVQSDDSEPAARPDSLFTRIVSWVLIGLFVVIIANIKPLKKN